VAMEETLRALEKPLLYISRNNWANITIVVGLQKALTRTLDNLESLTPPALAPTVAHIRAQLEDYDALGPSEKRRRLEAILSDIETLRNPPPPPSEVREMFSALDTPIQFIKGVGPKMAEKLARLNIRTVEDALYALPRDYEDRRNFSKIRELKEGDRATIIAKVALTGRTGRYARQFEALVQDDTGAMSLKWFNAGRWIEEKIHRGDQVVIFGAARRWRTQWEMHHPEVTVLEEGEDPGVGGILPIYHSTEGLGQWYLRRVAARAVEQFTASVPDAVPLAVRSRLNLMPLDEAFRRVHTPEEDDDIEALRLKTSAAHERLVFNEFFALEAGLALRRRGTIEEPAWPLTAPGSLIRKLVELLRFELTEAQKRVFKQMREDLRRPHPMNRLLQGDVGSGKTLVALMGGLLAVESGHQAVFMVPTEILAEQHYRTFRNLLDPLGVPVVLLLGKQKSAEKRRALDDVASGPPSLVVGTHAVIQEAVRFDRLAYAVVDEQHRFGVRQRQTLKTKGEEKVPHTLVMTATPIPRTLALTVYGDLKLSILDEMPPGRRPIKTRLVSERGREKAWDDVRREVQAGRRAYIVYPLVEESEKSEDLLDATGQAESLAKDVFPGLPLGLIHGRMKPEEKERVMLDFAAGRIRILVATTVIEVGIDVPEATIMVVEHAERFGLSQLHQLRGRVGRGENPSSCYLIYRYTRSDDARRRLEIMAETNDGFRIAEADLEIRGPGEFLGTRQSGMPDFRVANIARDGRVLIAAKKEAFQIVEGDPLLQAPQHQALRESLKRLWKGRLALAGVG